jgi:hypothetical protein
VPSRDHLPASPVGGPGPSAAGTTVWVLGPTIARADVPQLCAQLGRHLADTDAAVVICDVGAVTEPDLVTVEALARLQLTARRHGRRLWLLRACGPLRDLLALTGLCAAVPLHPPLAVEPRRQAEQREQALGVEEMVEPDDPAG